MRRRGLSAAFLFDAYRPIGLGSIGTLPRKPTASSIALATAKSFASPRGGPINWMPTGMPERVKPAGSDRAGSAVVVARKEKRSPVDIIWRPACRRLPLDIPARPASAPARPRRRRARRRSRGNSASGHRAAEHGSARRICATASESLPEAQYSRPAVRLKCLRTCSGERPVPAPYTPWRAASSRRSRRVPGEGRGRLLRPLRLLRSAFASAAAHDLLDLVLDRGRGRPGGAHRRCVPSAWRRLTASWEGLAAAPLPVKASGADRSRPSRREKGRCPITVRAIGPCTLSMEKPSGRAALPAGAARRRPQADDPAIGGRRAQRPPMSEPGLRALPWQCRGRAAREEPPARSTFPRIVGHAEDVVEGIGAGAHHRRVGLADSPHDAATRFKLFHPAGRSRRG